MTNIAILGSFAGDEGKGHITHHFSKNYDWIVRFNGGANAGHTIYRDGIKYVHNLMPSFDWRFERPKAFLSAGMVIDLEQLHKEVHLLWQKDNKIAKKVYVDPDVFLVLPEHKEEDKQTNGHIGSTNRGIGPAYKAKIGRQGLRIRDIIKSNQLIDNMCDMGVQFKGLLDLKSEFVNSEILFEGAQGIMLDINHGTYPYVSCSESTIAGVYSAGFHFAKPEKVYGVAKCYATKVGEGPFPTELFGEAATSLRERGGEYGATTGRPRRVGWLDLPALNYACLKGGITNLIFTKFDILDGMDYVPICSEYKQKVTCSADFFTAKPVYRNVPGWLNAKELMELDPFLDFVEENTGLFVNYISCGTSPDDIIQL